MWVNAGNVTECGLMQLQFSQAAFSQGLKIGAVNPTDKAKRLIVAHIGSKDGFVPDGLLCFESKKNTNAYHNKMNSNTFREWLQSVLPRLKHNAVFILDNAPYYSIKKEKCPTNWRIADIIGWL